MKPGFGDYLKKYFNKKDAEILTAPFLNLPKGKIWVIMDGHGAPLEGDTLFSSPYQNTPKLSDIKQQQCFIISHSFCESENWTR